MFSKIPPFTYTQVAGLTNSITTAFQLFHSTVNSTVYESIGAERQKENHCIFHYTVRGHGEVIHKNKSYITNPGEGFFNIINEIDSGYRYPAGYSEEWEFIVISFEGGNTRQVVKELLENKVVYKIGKMSEPLFGVMCDRLLEKYNSDMCFTFFPRLLSLLYEADKPSQKLSLQFEQIVARDLMKNPLIHSIAQEMNITREHLQREYFRQRGITPAKYLNHLRFEMLCKLLATSSTEQEIAQQMNFPSVSGLSIFFKKYAGISPKKFRENGCILI